LQSTNVIAAPFTFDIRGGGGFWGVEFDFMSPEAAKLGSKGKFATLVQERCLSDGLAIIGRMGGVNLEGTESHHCILAPPFNVTREEIDKIADIFVSSVEKVIKETLV
jgi:E3 ubiquitin-protein ligase TRIP12